ncbi:MAG: hypothetical protein V3R82_00065 [Candidatus Hydrothermarchaeales archaeon]
MVTETITSIRPALAVLIPFICAMLVLANWREKKRFERGLEYTCIDMHIFSGRLLDGTYIKRGRDCRIYAKKFLYLG